jgi:hypothetical protein
MDDARTQADLNFAQFQACNSHAVASYRQRCERAERERVLKAIEAWAHANFHPTEHWQIYTRVDASELRKIIAKLRQP